MPAFPLRLLMVATTLLLWTACGSPPSHAPEPEPAAAAPTPVRLGEEFRLSPGERVLIGETGLALEFMEVTEDSRCPIGERCIWAGQVTVLIGVGREDEKPAQSKLTLRVGESEPASEQVGDLMVRLTSVQPYPEPEKPIRPGDYSATLTAEENAPRE